MIREYRVHNFHTLINASFTFRPRHLLIGKNSSGKTNLCLSLGFLKLSATLDLAEAVKSIPGDAWDFCNYLVGVKDRQVTFSLIATLYSSAPPITYQYELGIRIADPRMMMRELAAHEVTFERLTVSGSSFSQTTLLEREGSMVKLLNEPRFHRNDSDSYTRSKAPSDTTMLSKVYEVDTNPTTVKFRDYLRGIAYYSLSPELIRGGLPEAKGTTGLRAFGANLAQCIYAMKNGHEGRYRRMLERVRRYDPQLAAVNFLTGPDQNVVPIVELEGNKVASWSSLSNGTLRALGFSYIFENASMLCEGPDALPPVLILEEPENSLFVGESRRLLDDADNVAPGAQIIYTTHSPYLIDQFDNDLDAVTILKRDEWHTKSESLSGRRAEIERALGESSLGEQFFRDMLG